ncbi:hypothetical protein, partial [Enterococcus faecium]|uniref:hypothetical protein n=1 Tax=Enterococcus faecium TaxID=1352 RepID=UPI00215D72C1
KLITLTPKDFTPKIKSINEKDKQLTCSDANRRFSRGFLFCLSFNQFITLIVNQKHIKSRNTSLIKLNFKKLVVDNSHKDKKKATKNVTIKTQKDRSAKTAELSFLKPWLSATPTS